MKGINFTKMAASGNDFVIMELDSRQSRLKSFNKLAQEACDRKFGIGADGLLLLGSSSRADIKMRVFNADGTEAEMCGNGGRCAALYTGRKKLSIETKAGIIKAEASGDRVKIKLPPPKHIRLDLPIRLNSRKLNVNFIDTGVPHAVIFVRGLDNIDIADIGRQIRYHKRFAPRGTNADFVEVLGKHFIKIRTYERGVEDETLACGTGAAAASLIFALKASCGNTISVLTRSKEILKVYFSGQGSCFSDVWLEGKTRIVCKGEYYV